MKKNNTSQMGYSKVDTKDLHPQKLLEAELITVGTQLRNFTRLRERLSADGIDANRHFTQLRMRHEELLAEFSKSAGRYFSPDPIKFPLAPPGNVKTQSLIPPFGGLGSHGFVQIPPPIATESHRVTGKHPMTGNIEAVPGSYPSVVAFKGQLGVGPESIPGDQWDPTIRYFWIRNWTFLVAFPPPPVESRFTYKFVAGAEVLPLFSGGEGQTMTFVSLGETNNLVSGVPVVANKDAGWPIVHDLKEPIDRYNGSYGPIYGDVTVQRSFMVGAQNVPGVAIVVGAIEGLSMMASLSLQFGGWSGLSLTSWAHPGAVEYSYEPVLVNHP